MIHRIDLQKLCTHLIINNINKIIKLITVVVQIHFIYFQLIVITFLLQHTSALN